MKRLLLFLALWVVWSAHATQWDTVAKKGMTHVIHPDGTTSAKVDWSSRAVTPSGPVVHTTSTVTYAAATAASLLKFASTPAGLVATVALPAFFEWWAMQEGNERAPDGTLLKEEFEPGTCDGSTIYNFARFDCELGASSDVVAKIQEMRICLQSRYGWTMKACTIPQAIACNFRRPDGSESITNIASKVVNGTCRPVDGSTPEWRVDEAETPPNSWAPYVLPTHTTGNTAPVMPAQLWDDFQGSPYAGQESAKKDIFDDENGYPWNTAEISAERDRLNKDLAERSGTDPATIPPPSSGPTYNPGDPDSPQKQPIVWDDAAAGPSDGASASAEATAELPPACEWWELACQWIEWTKEPVVSPTDDPALPVETAEPGSWDSGIGGGSCPPPVVISVLAASVPISWQPACDFVTLLRPLLLGIASVTAALILLGQRSGGTA
jgi:hypothetical protein